jgi:hypothetical protein
VSSISAMKEFPTVNCIHLLTRISVPVESKSLQSVTILLRFLSISKFKGVPEANSI